MSQKTLNEMTCDWCGFKEYVLPHAWKRIDIVRKRSPEERLKLQGDPINQFQPPRFFWEEVIGDDVCPICMQVLYRLKESKGLR